MNKKRFFFIIGGLFLIFIIFVGIQFMKTIKLASTTSIRAIAFDQIDDGIYEGNSDFGLVQVRLEVEVADHKLKNVNILEHQNGFGSKAEQMVDQMMMENRIDVDTISGATVSSKAIQKACEQALQK